MVESYRLGRDWSHHAPDQQTDEQAPGDRGHRPRQEPSPNGLTRRRSVGMYQLFRAG